MEQTTTKKLGCAVLELAIALVAQIALYYISRAIWITLPIMADVYKRQVGPALACIRHGKLPYFISKSIALFYRFHNEKDEQAVELEQYIAAHGLMAAMEKYSGLSDDVPEEKLLKQLVAAQDRDFELQKVARSVS